MERIGLFGGTFNPPHSGHLAVARLAVSELRLDRLYVCPNFISPFKRDMAEPGPQARFEMVQALCADDTALTAWSVELDRAGPSYTFDTLTHMAALHPQAKRYFICGADAALGLAGWYRADEFAGLATVAAVDRLGGNRPDLSALQAAMPEGVDAVSLQLATETELSSTLLRGLLAEGKLEQAAALMPEAVARVVADRGYYR